MSKSQYQQLKQLFILPSKEERNPFKGVIVATVVIVAANIGFQAFASEPQYREALSHSYYEFGGLMFAWLTWKVPAAAVKP